METQGLNDWNALMMPAQQQFLQAWLHYNEQLTRLHLETLGHCMELSLDEWRSMLEIHDAQSLQHYWQHQRRVLHDLDATLNEEIRGVREIGERFAREVAETGTEDAA